MFFTTLVGTLVGLRSADRTTLDVIHAYGGGAVAEADEGAPPRRAAEPVRRRCGSPRRPRSSARSSASTSAASGLGVAMIASQTSYQVNRTWGLALVAGLLACLAYGITALIGRALTPWAPRIER